MKTNRLTYFLEIRLAKTFLLYLLLIGCGFLVAHFSSITNQTNWYKLHYKDYSYCLLKIKGELEEKEKSYKAIVEVVSLIQDKKIGKTKGEALVYFKKSANAKQLLEGQYIVARNKFQDIRNSNNPGSFDYKLYCQLQNVYQSAYFIDKDYKVFPFKYGPNPIPLLSRANHWVRATLIKYLPDTSTHGIAMALLIGYRKSIDPEIYQAYSNTGLTHLIAISGMHVGMIYLGFQWILLLIPLCKKNKKAVIIISLIALWLFSFLIGLPPSVFRSAFMLTCISIGSLTQRKISIYNNLAFSAFVLLCIHPHWIFDVGFQLSYAALLGLSVCYKSIYHWLFIKNIILDNLWKLVAATIAAQIFTFPICLYYFHQFPSLFILNNLIAVFLTTIIIYAEIILLIFSAFKPLATLIGKCINELIIILNKCVVYLNHFDFALWNGIQINYVELVLLVLTIAAFVYTLFYKHLKSFALGGILLLLFVGSQIHTRWSSLHQKKLIVYNLPKQFSLGIISGEKYNEYYEDETTPNFKNNKYVFEPSRNYFHVRKKDSSIQQFYGHPHFDIILFHQKKIVRIKNTQFRCREKMYVDYVIISNVSKLQPDWVRQNFEPKSIILDSSIPSWKAEKMEKSLLHLGVPIHNIAKKGAFIATL